MRIRLRLYGVFRTAAGDSQLELEVLEERPSVRTVITQLVSQEQFKTLKNLLLEDGTADPRPNALIMVSGREIGTLNGLETQLGEDEELALLPVAHGG